MATLLNTNIRGEQVANATISGVHIVDYSLAPIKVDVYNAPTDGDVLTYKTSTSQFEWNSIGTMVVNEVPTGSINGANTTFVLNDTPVGNTLEVNLNGILQQPGVGNDYTASGVNLAFTIAPETGDIILCSYLVSTGLGGGVYTDHGNLDGLTDDDHSQYILVNGNRSFTGAVAGVTPTIAAHLATMGYVDTEIGSHTHDASDVISNTFADLRIAQSNVTQHVGAIDHNSLLNKHNLTTDIDHNALTNYVLGQHRTINDAGSAATDLWSAEKIGTAIASASGTTDHGELTGRDDDDHTQYLLADGTREGTDDFTISGSLTLYNNKRFYCKDTGGTARRIAYLSSSDQMIFGDISISQNYYRVYTDHIFQTYSGGTVTRMMISPTVGIQLYDDVTISAGHNLTISSGTVTIGSAGTLEAGQSSPTGSGVLGYNGYFYATKVYNAVYNDIADFQKVLDEIEYGKCYYDTTDGAKLCTERCQMAVIGIASDTFGFGVGNNNDESYAPFAIAGWALAHVDKEYPIGTPLTNNEEGILTEILPAEKREFPERIVATYKKKETAELWGPNDEIKVNGRSWVKVK